MLVRRSTGRAWSVDEVAQELNMSTGVVGASVVGLCKSGVLVTEQETPTRYRYQPRTLGLHAGAESLCAAYEADPIAVVKAVLNTAPRALRTFSDAFLFRRRDS